MFIAAATALSILLLGQARTEETKASTAPSKMSAFAPADDLTWQYEKTVADLERAVASAETYKDQPAERFVRDANSLSLVAIALAVHDQPNAVKPHAAATLAALKHLAAAKDYEGTKKAVNELKGSAPVPSAGPVTWSKVVSLDELMTKYVPSTNTALGSDVRKLPKRAKQVAAEAALLGVMAENAKLYSDDIATAETEKKWMAFCEAMRDAAAGVADKARAGDKAGTAAAMEKLNHSCHDCHAVFNPSK